MGRNCSVVGFIGIDKFEYIMYLSRVIYHLGKKILMVDCSDTGALTASVPFPKEVKNSVIEYRGIMFLDGRNTENKDPYGRKVANLQNLMKDYECILIDYGYNTDMDGLKTCDRIVCVTDQQLHNIRRVSGIGNLKEVRKCLIIKDYVNCNVTPKYIVSELKIDNLAAGQTYIVYQDETDAKCRINCQYDGVFRFHKLSIQAKNVVKGLLKDLLPEVTKKELDKAYKKAEKGE